MVRVHFTKSQTKQKISFHNWAVKQPSLPDKAAPEPPRHSSNIHNNRSFPLSDSILPSVLGPWDSHSSRSIYTFDRTEALVVAERGV